MSTRARSTVARESIPTAPRANRGPWPSRSFSNSCPRRTISSVPRRWPDCCPTPTRTSSGRSFAACPLRPTASGPSPRSCRRSSAPAQGDLALAQRQARLAPALLEFSRAELVWPMLIHRDDPSLRTELIHIMADYEVDPKVLFERLKAETNRSVRRALILALGGFAPERIPTAPARRSEGLAVILVQLGPRSRHPRRDRLGLAAGGGAPPAS